MSGYNYLLARLAQGSKPPTGVKLPFDVVVLAAKEYQPELPGHIVMHVPLNDREPSREEREAIRTAAREVVRHVRKGRRVLVTCNKGRNRSGVIAGLALVELGVTGLEAARRIQHLRNGLTNPFFLRMVVGS